MHDRKNKNNNFIGKNGYTLIELMVVVAIIAILLAIAMPSYNEFIQRSRIKNVAENFSASLRLAQSESRASKQLVCIEMTTGQTWSYTLRLIPSTTTACSAGGTILKTVSSSDYQNSSIESVTVNGSSYSSSQPPRFFGAQGTIKTQTGSLAALEITFKTNTSPEFKVRVRANPLGLITFCSPSGSGNMTEYPEC